VVVSTHEGEIASALNLERNLTTVLLVITGLALIGFVVAVAINAVAGVERKRKHLAVLKLVGYGRPWLMGIPLLQAGALALAGAILAVAAFGGVAMVVNAAFAGSLQGGEAACRLSALQLFGAGVATVVIAMIPALFGGLLAARVEPSLELRDV
jgi:putative ABC transport system permease protein